MNWRDVVLWYGPCLAWVALWTQFATIRFFDKNEAIFKDFVSSGAADLAVSQIESSKLIPALARLCDAVAHERSNRGEMGIGTSTEDLLSEVDFLPFLRDAEAGLREIHSVEEGLQKLQHIASVTWILGLVHGVAIILLPTSLFVPARNVRDVVFIFVAVVAFGTLVSLVIGSIRYQVARDVLIQCLSANRRAS